MLRMKATIDVPEDLYRRIKARAALRGRTVRDITIELYRQWLGEPERSTLTGDEWLRDWLAKADQAIRGARPGPPASELLDADRGRLEAPGSDSGRP